MDDKDKLLEEAIELIKWFCHRVEISEIISKKTYKLFKDFLDKV